KLMKLAWDAVGTEFGGRWELYEMNYAGNHEQIRYELLHAQQHSGAMDHYKALVDTCLSEYDEKGWTVPDLINPTDTTVIGTGRPISDLR
ncbi:4-hydroxyphenylacetate 3-hydroxylase C-terminal domain-containing protein, partial [Streptomyces sp. NRRL WC-3742]|uniref:4-hydroxyphenylacetate 3-hydroxylase C-terminal domain-containing protein n=1 Tax=Streptomyces sp. NRRL WC-3742 TaxID=1463934 RepID=UPI002D218BD7